MSDIKRYFTECSYGCSQGSYIDPNGEWVDYNDHVAEVARLKAEVERLESMADENAHLHKGIYSLSLNVGQLKDEVERLIKAGDACADASYAHCMCQDCEELRDQWRDAKRGNQP